MTVWDIKVEGGYQAVADAMAELVKSCDIDNVYLHAESTVGVDKNFEEVVGKKPLTWEHFFLTLPTAVVVSKSDIGSKLGSTRTSYEVMLRALTEISVDSVDMVLDLIAQGSLYRGEENQDTLLKFKALKAEFDELKTEKRKKLFCWSRVPTLHESISHIRNSSIGKLLVDLSEGKELEDAVNAFEAIVAPANYKRSKSLVTKGMIDPFS
jgi:chaperonin GroEL (HSP60 family)